MEKNEKEKRLFYEWGLNNEHKYSFPDIDRNKESYFIKKPKGSYIKEYGFETMPELMTELDAMWRGDDVMAQITKAAGVAAMKNKIQKPAEAGQDKKQITPSEETLPMYIYNF